jgi:hypothetical protein
MLRFLLSFTAVFGALFAWGSTAESGRLKLQEHGTLWLAAVLIGLPVACAWGVAELIDKRRPRRAFDARAKRPWTLVFAGLASGVLSVVIATPLITLVDWTSDAVSISAAAMAGATVVLLVLSRKKAGECVHCGYDLTAGAEPRCPECGAMYSAGG